MVFSKTTHYRGYLGKIWRNPKFRDCHLILGTYRNWLLKSGNTRYKLQYIAFPMRNFSISSKSIFHDWRRYQGKRWLHVTWRLDFRRSLVLFLPEKRRLAAWEANHDCDVNSKFNSCGVPGRRKCHLITTRRVSHNTCGSKHFYICRSLFWNFVFPAYWIRGEERGLLSRTAAGNRA